MSTVLVVVMVVLALDGVRGRALTPAVGRRWPGAAAASAVLVALAVVADPLADALDVSVASARAAAGIVVAAAGLVRVVVGAGRPWPEGGSLVPLAFPVLLAPEAVALAVGLGVDHTGAVVAGVAVGAALVVGVGAAPDPPAWLVAGVVRLGGVVLVVGAVAMVVDGVRRV